MTVVVLVACDTPVPIPFPTPSKDTIDSSSQANNQIAELEKELQAKEETIYELQQQVQELQREVDSLTTQQLPVPTTPTTPAPTTPTPTTPTPTMPTPTTPAPTTPTPTAPTPPIVFQQLEQQFGGIISDNSVLTMDTSPFSLTSPVQIPEGITLIIDPGVTLNFNGTFIQVDGTLQARGTPDSKIIFSNSVSSSDGNGIWFKKNSTPWSEEFETGCIIEYANMRINETGSGGTNAIWISGASPKISNSSIISSERLTIYLSGGGPIIDNNIFDRVGLLIGAQGTPVIENNIIKNTSTGIAIWSPFSSIRQNLIIDNGLGIQIKNNLMMENPWESSSITENTIVNNRIGIKVEQFQDDNGYAFIDIRSNSIHNNTEFNVYVEKASSIDVNFTNNWWGTTHPDMIERGLYHKTQDFRLGLIQYEPFLTERPTLAPLP